MFLGNGIAFYNQIFEDVNHVHYIVEHDRVGDEVHVFNLGHICQITLKYDWKLVLSFWGIDGKRFFCKATSA